MSDELQDAKNFAWHALGSTPVRRAMLGRQRCDAIVRVTMDALAADTGRTSGPSLRRRIEERVGRRYRDQSGMGFMTLVVVWAISSIVQALVIRWLSNHGGTR